MGGVATFGLKKLRTDFIISSLTSDMQYSCPLRFSRTVALNYAKFRECGHHANECQTYHSQPPPSTMQWANGEIQLHILLPLGEK